MALEKMSHIDEFLGSSLLDLRTRIESVLFLQLLSSLLPWLHTIVASSLAIYYCRATVFYVCIRFSRSPLFVHTSLTVYIRRMSVPVSLEVGTISTNRSNSVYSIRTLIFSWPLCSSGFTSGISVAHAIKRLASNLTFPNLWRQRPDLVVSDNDVDSADCGTTCVLTEKRSDCHVDSHGYTLWFPLAFRVFSLYCAFLLGWSSVCFALTHLQQTTNASYFFEGHKTSIKR